MSIKTRIEITCSFCYADEYLLEGDAPDPFAWIPISDGKTSTESWGFNIAIPEDAFLPPGWERVEHDVDGARVASARCPDCAFLALMAEFA
jgi:hypothetical protein